MSGLCEYELFAGTRFLQEETCDDVATEDGLCAAHADAAYHAELLAERW